MGGGGGGGGGFPVARPTDGLFSSDWPPPDAAPRRALDPDPAEDCPGGPCPAFWLQDWFGSMECQSGRLAVPVHRTALPPGGARGDVKRSTGRAPTLPFLQTVPALFPVKARRPEAVPLRRRDGPLFVCPGGRGRKLRQGLLLKASVSLLLTKRRRTRERADTGTAVAARRRTGAVLASASSRGVRVALPCRLAAETSQKSSCMFVPWVRTVFASACCSSIQPTRRLESLYMVI